MLLNFVCRPLKLLYRLLNYTLFLKLIFIFFSNIIGLPERRNKRKCFGNNKNVLFLNLNDKIIEQEMNKLAIPMLISDLGTPCSFCQILDWQ